MIQELEAKVDSLHSKNGVLELQADSLEVKLNESDGRIKQLNSRIYVIKRETQKQLNAVDLFGDDQLEQFFARRYRESDSIN
jgi:peptidoglycan hydrolase CwlO-like protein